MLTIELAKKLYWENDVKIKPALLTEKKSEGAKIIKNFMARLPDLIEAIVELFIVQLANPIFWMRISLSITTAFIRQIPRIVQGLIDGIKDGLKGIGGVLKYNYLYGAIAEQNDDAL